MELDGKWKALHDQCLEVMMSRPGFNELYLPFLERYVFASMQAARLADEIEKESLTVKHTNNKSKTNEATSPKVRVFALLNKEAIELARELGLSPASAFKMRFDKAKKQKGFDLTSMRIAK
jgi:P27 family predicted phage terminase small subunit